MNTLELMSIRLVGRAGVLKRSVMWLWGCLPGVVFVLGAVDSMAGEGGALKSTILEEKMDGGSEVNWLTGEGVSLGGIFYPSVHFRGVYGVADGESEDFRVSEHDPEADRLVVQGLELGMSLRAWNYLEGFVSYHAYLDEGDEVDGEWEEIFGKLVNLPGGFEVRGGQYLVRFGRHNAQHMHSWSFVDQSLAPGLMLGDHGLYMRGGEVTWNVPTPFTSALSFALGTGRAHTHGHGEEGHEHGHGEAVFDGEDALYSDDELFFAGRYMGRFAINDFHQFTAGVSGAYGENLFGRNTGIYGLDVEYLWRQNGLEAGGDYLRLGFEVIYRDIEARVGAHDHEHEGGHEHGEEAEHEEHHEEVGSMRGDYGELGFQLDATYGFGRQFEAGAQFGYVEGIGDLGLDERYRASAALTWYLTKERNLFARLQYNHDHREGHGEENSLWVQIGFDWGSPEVR